MSYTYGFFDAVDLGSGNYDRVYSSAEFSHYWALLVGDGVFGQPSTSLNVLATTPVAMSVKVSPGTGWIKGHYLTVPDNMDEVIAVPVANPSLPRIDSIIMALDNADRMMKLYVRSGTAAASPQPVSLQRDADIWELELAQVTVAAGAGNITQQAIKDMRTDPNRCGIVTGLIDQFDVSGFLTAAQASFDEWFENVQSQLGDDVAGNLLNLINGLQDTKEDKTVVSALATRVKTLEDTKSDLIIKQIVTSSTISFQDALSDVFVLLFGGGAGGRRDGRSYGGPGGGKMAYTTFTPSKSKAYSVIIGAGGGLGLKGGTSSFDNLLSAEGGSPGDSSGNGGAGGSGGGAAGGQSNARGGNASYGGGGGGRAGGGSGGTYGGGGGTETGSGGSGGTYGGNGGSNGATGQTGTPSSTIPSPFSTISPILTMTSNTQATGGTGKNACGGGGGGYGSSGGKGMRSNTSYHSGGGGGGGFFADGGDGADNLSGDSSGGGGGGGFFGRGGSATTRSGGAGGGGFLSEGGSSSYGGEPPSPVGYAAGGHSRSSTDSYVPDNLFYGGSGICIVAYIRKLEL